MTDQELKAMQELVYISREICSCMHTFPDRPTREIAGDGTDPDDELARLARAIDAAGRLVFPAWDHRHADEITA